MESAEISAQYNIGHICTTQQCEQGLSGKVAMRWISPLLEQRDYTFEKLDRLSSRFANVLQDLQVIPGSIIFTFLPKIPELFIAFLGSLKLQAVTGTLFSNFGEVSLLDRLGDAGAVGVVTNKSLLRKVLRIKDKLPLLRFIILVDVDEHIAPDILSLPLLMATAGDRFVVAPTSADTPSVLHYTSGSTGKPKGVLHAHRSILSLRHTTQRVLTLGAEDIFWCTADQGWITGTSYGIIGPWSLGVTQVHYCGAYDAEQWLNILQQEKVTVWYTSPTGLRMLMREDDKIFRRYDLSSLRHINTVGEPLNPEVIYWAGRTLGKDVYDTWFQTETGAIMIANVPGLEIRPGSMGIPIKGVEAAILDDDGTALPSGSLGNLCIREGWPSMFCAYLNSPLAYSSSVKNGYYYTGDTACCDADGYYWFRGRSDDIINTSGHLVSPVEIESVLMEVEEIAEAVVIGMPDDLLNQKVVAFVLLRHNALYNRELELKIRLHVTHRLSSIALPQEIICEVSFPKNNSGKIMRRLLKARYLGTAIGDISTLED